jgi:hypothetical protein
MNKKVSFNNFSFQKEQLLKRENRESEPLITKINTGVYENKKAES